MPRLTNTAPNRLLGHEIQPISDDPVLLLVNLETDDGTIEILMNEEGARGLFEDIRDSLPSK